MSGSRIAVIGMAGRFPGAPDVEHFWKLLREGVEGIRRFSAAELAAAGVDAALARRAEYVAACGALDGIENFDADFFGIPPREAELMDPQHRIFLEMAWEALEDAGYAGDSGLGRTGVYAGAGLSTYLLHNLLTSPDLARFAAPLQILIANNKDSMPTRVSYRLNLRGPSLNISTACSTSLVAVHVACQALLNQECDVALAGGIGIQIPQDRGYLYEPEGILSPDGHCRAFDRQAAGTVSGNGGGIVVLKRLEDAQADRDPIRAVILGTAINNDGAEKAGFTAPSVSGQMEVVAEALGLADVPADSIGYIEAHGTGTPVGDPIELRALTTVFRRRTSRRQFCAIGSVKTNVGHLDEGAGVAGLIKTVLALEHRQIPPSLHYTEPNPECELETSPFFVPTTLRDWAPADGSGAPRRAGVSSFGIGGTNAHVVLEEAPNVEVRPAADAAHSLALSARSPRGLDELSARLAERLQNDPSLDLADVAHTLRVGRRVFAFRRTIVCRDRLDAIAQLRKPAESVDTDSGQEPAGDANRRRVSLPTTPFERKRYWIGAPASAEVRVSPEPATSASVDSWLYVPGWKPAPRVVDATPRSGMVVAFVPSLRSAWVESLIAGLGARGSEVVTVIAGERYLRCDALAFEVRPGEPSDYDALFDALSAERRTPETVVHLWQVTGPAAIDDQVMLTLGFDSVLCLAKAIGRLDAGSLRLAVVTDAGQAIESDDHVRPEKSTMGGLVRAIAVEYPSIACAHIDLAGAGPGGQEETDAVVADILDHQQTDPTIAYRRARRLMPFFSAAGLRPVSESSRDLIRDDGVYLITGGLGSMGLAFAEWIASRARATIVLIARPMGSIQGLTPPQVTTDRVAAMVSRGSRVEVSRVDVADVAAMHQLVTDVRARFGRITGVIHTAGVIGRGFLRSKSVQEARRVLAPKLQGARALETALGDDPPDFLVLCSGLASRYPVAGQTDYAAANSALDGFAHYYARASGTRVVSIGWGFWQELGLIEKSAMPKAEQQQIAAEIADKGWATAGVQAFETILFRGNGPEILVYPEQLPGTATGDVSPSSRARPSHPLLIERIDESGSPAYRVEFTGEGRWILDEHRLDGDAVLPGTAYLELMRAAYVDLHGANTRAIELRDVIFLQPFMAEPDRAPELRVVLQKHDDRTDVFVVSQADAADRWHLCARAEIVPLADDDGHVMNPLITLDEERAGCLPAEFASRMAGFGPRWNNVSAVRFESDAGIARLQLPASFEGETSVFGLHPALLDNATGFFPIERRTEPRVPFSYQSIKIRRPLHGTILSYATAHGPAGGPEESFDVVLTDGSGRAAVEVSGYRFRRLKLRAQPGQDSEDGRDAALQIGARGLLDTLSFAASSRTAPKDDEVEIRVEAAGVNFIEVLYGLGMLPERRDGAFPFGLECAGVVTRAGAHTSLRQGQAVAAFTNGSDRLFATIAARNVAEMPAGLSFEEAATIPAAYMTAYAALCEYGRLQPGQRVLIHSACGGVGLAAVHVARWVGARILATAGTEDKRAFLRQMGIETVMESRSRAFVADTMAATAGAGVDVVLNSLSGDLIEAGLSVLGPGGRFLELGKRDILEGARLPLSHFQRRLSFIAVDVGPDLPEFGRLWREVWARVASGDFPPLPRQTFAATEAAAAFAEMAKGRHIGKFVLSFADRDAIQRQATATPVDRGRRLADILGPAPVRTSKISAPPQAVAPRAVEGPASAPGDAIERVIFGIWEDLLGRKDIARDDDFFAMNGDSLVGAQVISRMHQALGVKIPLSAIFDHPTVAQLGALVRKTSGVAPVIAAGMAGDHVDHGPTSGIYDVSAGQQRLWVLHQLDPGTAAYHIPLVHQLDGHLHVSALRQAIEWLTVRHEALRTTIPAEGGAPSQRIAATSGSLMTILDLSHAADPDGEARAETQRIIEQPFDLANGPLARFVLIRTAAERHVLVVVLHHIISDGVSIAILMRDLQAAYAAATSGRALDVPRRTVQYRDCAGWQKEYLEGDEAAAHRDYWLGRLAAPLARIDLPTDYPRPAAALSDGSEELFVIDREMVDGLRRVCRSHGATLFMGLVATVKSLLHRYTGAEDIVVGTPAAGRDHADAASVVGVFINTLVLRDTLTPEMTFGDVLTSVRDSSKAAFDHAIYPFDRLVQDLNTDRDPGRSPVFDVMVILQNQQTDSLTFPGLEVTPIEAHTGTSKYDLTFNFHESGGAVSMGIEYRTSLFAPGRIRRMGAHLLRLLRDGASNPARPVEQLELMPPDERELVVRGWNATDRAFALDRTVPDLFFERVRERPDAVAVACGDQTLTYGELGRRSSRIAAHLRQLGVGRGAIVAVYLDRSIDMIAALLGVLASGAAYTPMDPAYPADRLELQLRDSGARVVLTEQALAERLPAGSHTLVCVESLDDEPKNSSRSHFLAAAADDLAYVIYTSGSTGAPKGVQITHRNLTNLLFSMAEAPGLKADDVLLAVTSLSFDIAGLELYLPLVTGARLVIATTEETHDGAHLLARASACGATVMQGTPATWRLLIAAGWRGSSSFKALCGGELLSDGLANDLLDRAGHVWNLYGPTETTIWSLLHRVEPTGTVRHPHAGVPIGRPIANTRAYLLDGRGMPVPRGYPGDLYLGGEGVAPGYLHRPDLTAERFVPDPFDGRGRQMYRTGDRAVALEDGAMQFLGRDDHQVKIRGFRVELGEIEEALARHASVAEAVAVATGEPTDHTLVAYVVLGSGAAFDPIDLRAHLARSLPPQAIPSLIMRLDRLPLTPNGKVDRRALPRPDRASVGAPLAVAPRDARERTIRDVWAMVLDLEDIGIHDNFFELGGHSLRATRVTYLLQSALGVDVNLIDIFKAPTIAELAVRLADRPALDTIGTRPIASSSDHVSERTQTIAPMTPEEAQLLGDV